MRLAILLALTAGLGLCSGAHAAPQPQTSWGKAGISFEAYRADALACGREGANLDVSKTEGARVLVNASRQLDTLTETGAPDSGNQQSDSFPSAGAAADSTLDVSFNPAVARALELSHRMATVTQAARADEQVRQVGQVMRVAIEQCLVGRGYRKFRLTSDQMRHLDTLRRGTDARRAYLFSLASDPEVLRDQTT